MTTSAARLIAAGAVVLTVGAVTVPATAATGGHHKAHHHSAKKSGHHHKSSGHHKKKATTPAAPGSGFGAYDTSATAYGVRVPFYSHQSEDVEAESPYALSTLGIGGVGHAVTSVFWPGDTGAHGGDVIDLLGIPGVPKSVKQELNDPEKAEAQSSVGSPTVTKSGPGFQMTSTATASKVTADSHAGGSAVPTAGKYFGQTSSTTSIVLKGAHTAVLTAVSSLHNVSIAKVLTIDNITTTARAVTNGKTASGTSHIVITGAKIAGQPVTIDEKGIHLTKKGPKIPLVDPSTVVNKALKQANIAIHLTPGKKKVKGSTVDITSGSLTVHLGNASYTGQDNDTGTLLLVGGAVLSATSSPGFGDTSVSGIKPVKAAKTTTTGGSQGTAGTPGTPGTPGSSSGLPGAGTTSAGSGGQSPVLAAADFKLPGGLKLWWVLLSALAAGAVAFGLKRLPDRVLEATGGPCRLEDTSAGGQ